MEPIEPFDPDAAPNTEPTVDGEWLSEFEAELAATIVDAIDRWLMGQ